MLKKRKEKQMDMIVTEYNGNGSSYKTMTDTELVHLVKRGQNDAYDEIYRRYNDKIKIHVTGILRNLQEAEDITQDIFEERLPGNINKLSENAGEKGTVHLQGWLYKVATNMALNTIRDKRRRETLLRMYERDGSCDETSTEMVHGRELQAQIEYALGRVTQEHEKILRLRYHGDMSYNEIAAALGMKLGTVMSRLSRARDSLLKRTPELEELVG